MGPNHIERIPNAKVIASGVTSQTYTNSTGSAQEFTSFYTFPANTIFANKKYLVLVEFKTVTGVTTATISLQLKLVSGAAASTTIFSSGNSPNLTNSETRVTTQAWVITGRAAVGAAAAISCSGVGAALNGGVTTNAATSPVNIATNDTQAINVAVTYAVTTDAQDSIEQLGYMIMELN